MLNQVVRRSARQVEISKTVGESSELDGRWGCGCMWDRRPAGTVVFICLHLHWWQRTCSSQLGAAADGHSRRQPPRTQLMSSEESFSLVRGRRADAVWYPCWIGRAASSQSPKFRNLSEMNRGVQAGRSASLWAGKWKWCQTPMKRQHRWGDWWGEAAQQAGTGISCLERSPAEVSPNNHPKMCAW